MSASAEIHHLHTGFVSTRFFGTDGVSLETEKWAQVLEGLGHTCFYFAGECDEPAAVSRVVPEAFFKHPEVAAINNVLFSQRTRPPEITRRIHALKDQLKDNLHAFVRGFGLDLLVVENALAIPIHIPLGLALTEFIAETGIPVIAHHHDLFWERKRFLVNCAWDFINMAFPPHLPTVHHVVINSSAANQLALRTGISSLLIPNVMDFDHPPAAPDAYALEVRRDLGLEPDEKLVLQPTRIVQRKGIEHAIELISRLGMKSRLVISHASGDEGYEYEQHIRSYAALLGVPTLYISEMIQETRGLTPDGLRVFTLADVYPQADLVTYPSDIEGFGNAFLEAVYYRRPVVVNNYSIFNLDIKPKGFRVIEFDGFITEDTVLQAVRALTDPGFTAEMVECNYELARRFYSLTMLERRLVTILARIFGE